MCCEVPPVAEPTNSVPRRSRAAPEVVVIAALPALLLAVNVKPALLVTAPVPSEPLVTPSPT